MFMFIVVCTEFSHLTNHIARTEGSTFSTQQEALAHLETVLAAYAKRNNEIRRSSANRFAVNSLSPVNRWVRTFHIECEDVSVYC